MSDDMKQELNGVKTRLNGVEVHLKGIDNRLNGIDTRLHGIEVEGRETRKVLRNVAIAVTKLGASLDGITSYMKENLVTKDEFHGRVDAFVRKQDEMRFDWGQHHIRLDNHDKRLTRLEGRRA